MAAKRGPPVHLWLPKVDCLCQKWTRGGPLLAAKVGPRVHFWQPKVDLAGPIQTATDHLAILWLTIIY